MSYQKYYVPEDSKYPIYIAIALFLLVMGAASTINDLGKPDSNAVYILYSGFTIFAITLYFWLMNDLNFGFEASAYSMWAHPS